MVDYHDEAILPFPRQRIWQLIDAHLDPALIGRIHPLIRSQETVTSRPEETVLKRTIDVRGELMNSRWRLTSQPPEMFRWEVLQSDGPWAEGTWLENRYSEVPAGTRVESRGKLKVSVLPFLIPQSPVIRRVLSDLDVEDIAYLKG
jgi:hypothetical protein